MLWTRIVGALVFLIVMTFALQWILPRGGRGQRISTGQYVMWDIAPIVGFFGGLMLVLSLIDAQRGAVLSAWLLGGAVGLAVSLSAWFAVVFAGNPQPATGKPRKESPLRRVWKIVRIYGPVILVFIIGANIAARFLGAIVEVFLAGVMGVFLVAFAALIFAKGRILRQQERRK